jgi:hypothetical protein
MTADAQSPFPAAVESSARSMSLPAFAGAIFLLGIADSMCSGSPDR